MNRRELVALLGALGLDWYRPARAQQTMPVIGFLHSGAPGPNANRLTGFRKGLRVGGFVEGQNVAIEFRWAEDRNDRLPELAADLVRRRVNVITALSAIQAALAAKAATSTIAIVFQVGTDPVAFEFVLNLKAAKGLGLVVPANVLALADEVIDCRGRCPYLLSQGKEPGRGSRSDHVVSFGGQGGGWTEKRLPHWVCLAQRSAGAFDGGALRSQR